MRAPDPQPQPRPRPPVVVYPPGLRGAVLAAAAGGSMSWWRFRLAMWAAGMVDRFSGVGHGR